MRSQRFMHAVAVIVLLVSMRAAPAAAQPYTVVPHVTVGGASAGCVAGPYSLAGAIGQHDASNLATGGVYGIASGFWGIELSIPTSPPTDTDADFLPDAWEQQFGLGTTCGNLADGSNGDPDHDGKTNAQELAAGTHPRGFFTTYLAEGAVNEFFTTQIALLNPSPGTQSVTLLRIQPEAGSGETHTLVNVPPEAQRTVTRDTLASLVTGAFSTIVESDIPVTVDRTMSWDAASYGSTSESGMAQPSAVWYLAEGATGGPFDLFYLLQNMNDTPVDVDIKYLRALGAPPLTKSYHLDPRSRKTIWVDSERFPDPGGPTLLDNGDIGAVLTVTSGGPILVERALYSSLTGPAFSAGTNNPGIPAPATSWFLAEGATGTFFDLYVLLANPGSIAANVTVHYLLTDGTTLTKSYVVDANSRKTLWVDAEEFPDGSGNRPLASAALSTRVDADQPIVVERTMWWPDGAWYEGHSSAATTESGTKWATAGGETGGAKNNQTYVLVANVDTVAASIRVTVMPEDGGAPIVWEPPAPIPAQSRFNVPIGDDLFPGINGRRYGVVVESLGSPGAQLVVERAIYWDANGLTWAAGAAARGTKLQ